MGDVAGDGVEGFFGDDHSDGAIVDEDSLADVEVVDKSGVVGGDVEVAVGGGVAAEDGIAMDGDDIAGAEWHGVIFDLSDADFWAAEVRHDGDGPAGGVADGFEVGEFLFV